MAVVEVSAMKSEHLHHEYKFPDEDDAMRYDIPERLAFNISRSRSRVDDNASRKAVFVVSISRFQTCLVRFWHHTLIAEPSCDR